MQTRLEQLNFYLTLDISRKNPFEITAMDQAEFQSGKAEKV